LRSEINNLQALARPFISHRKSFPQKLPREKTAIDVSVDPGALCDRLRVL